ncbi:MAG: hypothetical protein P8Z81_00860 [Deinococcales bacterium]
MRRRATDGRNAPTTGLRLPVYGAARIENNGQTVAVRVKALAALYYLALHGSATREELAALLWEGPASRQNLRVNLHTLRRTLAGLGYVVFPDATDPLHLPEVISIDDSVRYEQALQGLDGLSPDYQLWLESARAELEKRSQRLPLLQPLVDRLAAGIEVPSVLILETPPGAQTGQIAQEIAHRLDLPLAETLTGTRRAVRYLQDYANLDRRQLLAAMEQNASLLILERPLYGQDPRLLLEVRSRYPAESLRYVELPTLTWHEVREPLLQSFSFAEAARIFLESNGDARYLQELLNMTAPGHREFGSSVPHRIRAAYELFVRELSPEAQLGLRRLSVHPGHLPDALVEAGASGPALYELELHNWLRYDGSWSIHGAIAQRVVYQSLPPGQRVQFHSGAAELLEAEGSALGALYHRLRADQRIERKAVLEHLRGWSKAVVGSVLEVPVALDALSSFDVGPSEPVRPRLTAVEGGGVRVEDLTMRWWRTPDAGAVSRVRWSVPHRPLLVRLRGHALVHDALGVGIDGDAVPLRVTTAGHTFNVVLCEVPRAGRIGSDIVLPLSPQFRHSLLLPASDSLALESRAHTAVLDVEMDVSALPDAGAEDEAAATELTARAIDLRAADGAPPWRSGGV